MNHKTKKFLGFVACITIASLGTFAFLILFIDSLPG